VMRNCENAFDDADNELPGGMLVTECPVSLIDPVSSWYIDRFWSCHHIEIGYASACVVRDSFLYSGGVFDQPNSIVEAFDVITDEYQKHFRRKEKEAMKK